VALSVLLLFMFVMWDMGIAVLRSNCLSECARRAARVAIVRGERSAEALALGPESWSGTAADSHPATDAIRQLLVGVSPEDVQVSITWPDGTHRVGQRVRIELSCEYSRSIPVPLCPETWHITASSTMRIVH
jgi:hypothetical protein